MTKQFHYRLSAVALLTVSLAGCAHLEEEVAPASMTQNSSADLTYQYYSNLPEPFVHVTAVGNRSQGVVGNQLWGLGRTQISGGYKIYYHQQTIVLSGGPTSYGPHDYGSWQTISGPNGGGAVKIAAGRGLPLYVVTSDNKLWVQSAGIWTYTNYDAIDVALGDGQVYFLGTANIPGGHPIYRLVDGVATEVSPGAAGVSIAVDYGGRPWVTTSVKHIYASDGRTVAVLGNSYETTGHPVFKRNAYDPTSEYTWAYEGGQAVQIAGNGEEGYFVVASNGELYKGL